MKSVFYLLCFVSFITLNQSCTKDNNNDEQKSSEADKDSSFVRTTQYVFTGTVMDTLRFWEYGVSEFQRGNSSTLTGDYEDANKSLIFWLTSNADYTTRFELTTPAYEVNSPDSFSKVLSVGAKEIGNGYNQFKIKLNLNNTDYTSYGDQTNSTFYVLKTELSKDESNRDIVKIWCKFSCRFYDLNGNHVFDVDDGYTLSEFIYNF